jgi:hypothetical protein
MASNRFPGMVKREAFKNECNGFRESSAAARCGCLRRRRLHATRNRRSGTLQTAYSRMVHCRRCGFARNDGTKTGKRPHVQPQLFFDALNADSLQKEGFEKFENAQMNQNSLLTASAAKILGIKQLDIQDKTRIRCRWASSVISITNRFTNP